MRTFFRNLIDETIDMREKQGIVRPDMIHLLMESRKSAVAHENQAEESELPKAKKKQHLSNEDITAQALIFFLAGFDTVSTLMCYMAHELALNPEVQSKLRDEIDEAWAESNGDITYEKLMNLKYLDMVTSGKRPQQLLDYQLRSNERILTETSLITMITKHISLFCSNCCIYRVKNFPPHYNTTISFLFLLWLYNIFFRNSKKMATYRSNRSYQRETVHNTGERTEWTDVTFEFGLPTLVAYLPNSERSEILSGSWKVRPGALQRRKQI